MRMTIVILDRIKLFSVESQNLLQKHIYIK